MSKYTPGPWHIHEARSGITIEWDHKPQTVPCPSGMYIAFLPFRRTGAGRAQPVRFHKVETDEANARLIAAAPDLLEAAKHAQCSCTTAQRDSGHSVDCWMPDLRAAIAKAEGQS
jgi:hypothetical protein